MPTNSELGAELLVDAASFFRDVGSQNPGVKEQMEQNAEVYEQVAQPVATDPNGEVPGQPAPPTNSSKARLFRRSCAEARPQ